MYYRFVTTTKTKFEFSAYFWTANQSNELIESGRLLYAWGEIVRGARGYSKRHDV